jgi:hypothetical protein
MLVLQTWVAAAEEEHARNRAWGLRARRLSALRNTLLKAEVRASVESDFRDYVTAIGVGDPLPRKGVVKAKVPGLVLVVVCCACGVFVLFSQLFIFLSIEVWCGQPFHAFYLQAVSRRHYDQALIQYPGASSLLMFLVSLCCVCARCCVCLCF